ncbi:hypothetical protein C2G38_2207220 [Gigaspora rosea]|uniref:Uncharacterized protein n=1 Tax=Gigaspora rosea TaxID=44941 RepID=A0A397UIA1_9GLOM|nr:hypothetical protein C2G38_2207220 [Gigaspora rosea]
MVKRMRSDAVLLSPEDYKFIIQYRDAKPKTEVLKELRKKYPMANDRFYRIWRGQEVSMIEWYQPISESITPPSQDLPISELSSESRSPSIGYTSSTDRSSITGNSNQINKDILHLTSIGAPNKQVKNRKPRSKTVRISDSPNVISKADKIYDLSKKVGGKDDMYTLIEREGREAEEAERESERFLNLN